MPALMLMITRKVIKISPHAQGKSTHDLERELNCHVIGNCNSDEACRLCRCRVISKPDKDSATPLQCDLVVPRSSCASHACKTITEIDRCRIHRCVQSAFSIDARSFADRERTIIPGCTNCDTTTIDCHSKHQDLKCHNFLLIRSSKNIYAIKITRTPSKPKNKLFTTSAQSVDDIHRI